MATKDERQELRSSILGLFSKTFISCGVANSDLRRVTGNVPWPKSTSGELLETSAIAFGVRDHRSPHIWLAPGEQKEIAHYVATQTGGQYLDATPATYADALEEILRQLHFRYELGFEPIALDGKRHKLIVKLVDSVGNQHKGLLLRYRAAYVPVRR